MQLGERNHQRPSARRLKVAGVLAATALLALIASTLIHLVYREMPGLVVGSEFEISSRVDGTVSRIHRRENEAYRDGEELVIVESENIRTQLTATERDLEEITRSLASEKSEGGLDRRRAELQTAIATNESEYRSSKVEIETLDQVLPGLREWRSLAADRLRRGEELRAQDAITLAELEERRRGYAEAEGKLQEAVAHQGALAARVANLTDVLALQRSRLKNLVAERTAFITELELKQQEKVGERAQLQASLADLRLSADHNGVVTAILRQEGEYVPSGGPILRVMRDDDLWVEAYLPVAERRHVQLGDRVEVVGKMAGVLRGRVTKVLPVLKPLPNSYQSPLGGTENYLVLVITLEDSDFAREVLSPAQQVTARIRKRLPFPGDRQANAQGKE